MYSKLGVKVKILDQLFAVKVIAKYEFTNGSNSQMNYIFVGSSIEEIFDTVIYCIVSSDVETYEDGVVWFKAIDALEPKDTKFYYHHNSKNLVIHFDYSRNPLLMKSLDLHIENIEEYDIFNLSNEHEQELLKKSKTNLVLTKDVHKFRYEFEHADTLNHQSIQTLETLFIANKDVGKDNFIKLFPANDQIEHTNF